MSDVKQWTYDTVGRDGSGARLPDPDLAYEVRDYDGAPRARFRVGPDAARYVRDRNRADGIATETGDAHGEIADNLRGRLNDLALLQAAASASEGEEFSNDELLAVGVGCGVPGALTTEQVREMAVEALDAYPLCVEATTTFEIVIGTGGPDDRLLIECDSYDRSPEGYSETAYEIRRVLYRYSWSNSAEVVLRGDDRETAEAFARRVVPELVE